MTRKLVIGVIFGGRSGEHEVSLVSAGSVVEEMDKKKYKIILIGISKKGHMIIGADAMERLKTDDEIERSEVLISSDPSDYGLIRLKDLKRIKIDCFFPILHGPYGEDGTVQGLLELSGVPYVGAGVLGSACGMDKIIMKKLFRLAGLLVADDLSFLRSEIENIGILDIKILGNLPALSTGQAGGRQGLEIKKLGKKKLYFLKNVENKIGYPCFIKPANMGSSVGISKAWNCEELIGGIQEAFKYDQKILIEKSVENAREIECAVLGNNKPRVSVCGEILPSEEFYSYKAKYVDESKTVAPVDLPKRISAEIKKQAIVAFRAIDCAGMGRVDFLIKNNFSKIYVNEINTIPGFTSISMYPKLWQKSGVKYSELIDRLIELGIERVGEKRELQVSC